jgi:hypothetical protein
VRREDVDLEASLNSLESLLLSILLLLSLLLLDEEEEDEEEEDEDEDEDEEDEEEDEDISTTRLALLCVELSFFFGFPIDFFISCASFFKDCNCDDS